MTSKRSVTHATFIVERTYPAKPARVFAAFADPVAKARWFGGSDDPANSAFKLDFRVGGRESNAGGPPGGPIYTFDALYQDIVPNERIVTTYEMCMDKQRISVSVATVELLPDGAGSRVIYTEQAAFLDGLDDPDIRKQGVGDLLDALGRELQRETAKA